MSTAMNIAAVISDATPLFVRQDVEIQVIRFEDYSLLETVFLLIRTYRLWVGVTVC